MRGASCRYKFQKSFGPCGRKAAENPRFSGTAIIYAPNVDESQEINKTTTTMATPLNSWKCLSAPSTRTFSTSSVRNAMPIIKKLSGETKKGQKKSARIKSKPPPKPTGKPPMPGERKAMRKRIVLSNTNAIPVEMKDFGREMTEGREMEEWVGKVVGIGGETVDGLRAAEGFQAAQGWGFFRRPGMLVRKESVEVVGRLVGCEGRKGGLRLLVDGAKETGKSMLLLQAMATAFVRGWIVLHVPDGKST